jgi:hypothetical protein
MAAQVAREILNDEEYADADTSVFSKRRISMWTLMILRKEEI